MKSLPHLMETARRSPDRDSSSLSEDAAMCDVDTAVSTIHRYIDKHLFSPSASWEKCKFQKRSYQQWAAYEICDRILDKPFDDPIVVIDEFAMEMSVYASHGTDDFRKIIFENAAEIAEDLILLFV